MIALTLAQESLLDRIRVCCLCSPGEILSGTYSELCRAIHKPEQHEDFLTLVAGGMICLAQIGERWNIWVVKQGAPL